jgi:hypothetical protein
MADRYGIYCGSFTHAGGTLDLRQLEEQDITADARYKTIRPGGALTPAAHILSTANPRCRFVTCDLETVLAAMSPNLFLFCSGGHVMRYQKRAEGGAFMTGSDHLIQSTAKGFLHVLGIDVDIDSDDGARMNLEYVPLSVAGENPVTTTAAQSLGAAPAPAFMSQFFMGGTWLGAAQALGLKRASIRPGTRFGSNRSDGGVFARSDASSIQAFDPVFDLTFLNAGIPITIGSFFMNALSAALKVYFQRGTTAADGRIAAATASHTRIQAAAGSWGADGLRVAGEEDTLATVRVMPTGSLTVTPNVALGA